MHSIDQIDLFEHVAGAYAQPTSGRLSNDDLYRMCTGRAGVNRANLEIKHSIGKSGEKHCTLKRKIRWYQQDLKQMGILEKVEGKRGIWELTASGRAKLQKIRDDVCVLGFSTNLGVAILGNCARVFQNWNEPIFLALTSPPYPLQTPRAYGNPTVVEYIDFICRTLEPIVKNLVPGGNVALSLSNDIFESKSPARSLYLEKLTIALNERLGLELMDRLVWESNKPPGPVAWASKQRMQLNATYEPVLWFCNDPARCIADNRRVLEPHTEQHLNLVKAGGESRSVVNGDGAYRLYPGSYGAQTEGRIPRNVLKVGNVCASQRAYKAEARDLGLAVHGATMPLALARKLVKFLSDVDQLVVDPFGGSMTTGLAAELEGRRWASSEMSVDYVAGASTRFKSFEGFDGPLLAAHQSGSFVGHADDEL